MPLPQKITILGGAGGVGSTMAFYLGLKEIASEIALSDIRPNVLETHLIDLRECLSQESSTTITAGSQEILAGSNLVILAAARQESPVSSRNDYLDNNLALVIQSAQAVKDHCPEATVIVTTAPTDVFTLVFHDILGGDRRRLLGFCNNDSIRFRYALGQVLGVDPKRLTGLVLGEHGQAQLPVFSSVTLDQEPLLLTSAQKARVLSHLSRWYAHWQAQNSGRTTTWTSATSMARMILSLYGQSEETLMGSVVLDGEYGLAGVALGLALIPDPAGQGAWAGTREINLSFEDRNALGRSAQSVRELYLRARQNYQPA
ncbi:MAG: hypothetical protein LBR11_12915 [Deltaproteobacteria bacterium]|jgi:L-lactate dehydrogenase/malate dehydrogenase|nr:hypothetical protein [Deltaproteobacteria bacterium]